MDSIEYADDQMGVAVDVRTDLKYRDSAISAGQFEMIGLRQDHRRLYGSPSESLHTEGESDFFGERRHVVVMEDEVCHGL